MHKQTQSIHQQSDRYVDESELPFTPSPVPPAGGDVFAVARVIETRVATDAEERVSGSG
jgi:hypothetical protein